VLSPPLPAINFAAGDDAYSPTDAWNPPASGRVRRLVITFGALYAILAVGLSLWRSRLVLPAQIALAGLLVVGILVWAGHQSTAAVATGRVYAGDSTLAVCDHWTFTKGRRIGKSALRFVDLTMPLFAADVQGADAHGADAQGADAHGADAQGADASLSATPGVTLRCDADGSPASIEFPTAPDRAMVFCSRSIVTGGPTDTGATDGGAFGAMSGPGSAVAGLFDANSNVSSPLRMLLRSFYPDQEVKGGVTPKSVAGEEIQAWPGLVLSARSGSP
jgi:hypothetical protein